MTSSQRRRAVEEKAGARRNSPWRYRSPSLLELLLRQEWEKLVNDGGL